MAEAKQDAVVSPSIIIVGKKEGGEVKLAEAVSVIGRDRGVTVELGDFQVSRRHALLLKTDAGCFVKDLGSRNGILVNEKRLASRKQQKLKNGDVLTLGRTTIIFKDESTAGGAVAPAPPGLAGVHTVEAKVPPLAPARATAKKPALLELSADPPPPRGATPPSFATNVAGDELGAFKDILERSERERVFYRNVTLALVGFLMLLVTLLLYYALGRSDRSQRASAPEPARVAAPSPTPIASTEPTPTPIASAAPRRIEVSAIALSPSSNARELDVKLFVDDVGPLLLRSCATAGCHGPPNGAGELKLEPFADEAAVARDLEAARRFVVPGHPEKSVLLTKPLRREDGGEGHGGGDVLVRASAAYETLRSWIASPVTRVAANGEHKPKGKATAHATSVSVGQPFILDASGSTDECGCALQYRWAILDRPDGSQASLKDPFAAVATLVPDKPGDYVVCLVVHDGKTPSDPARLDLKATPKQATQERPDPAGQGRPSPATPERPENGARPLSAEPNGRAFVRAVSIDLLGRGPKLDETEKALAGSRAALADDLFARDELYDEWLAQEYDALLLVDQSRPQGEPFASLAKKLRAGEITARGALELVVAGKPLEQRYPASDAFVGAVLSRLLGLDLLSADGRALIESGKRMVDGQQETLFGKSGNGREDFVKICLDDPRFTERLLARENARVLGATSLSQAVLAAALGRLAKEPGAFFAIVREWILSPRYVDAFKNLRPKSERAFVRTLYVDVLGRAPDELELRDARSALRHSQDSAVRAAFAKTLLDGRGAQPIEVGADARAFVVDQFQRLLGRAPQPRELDTYVRALSEGASGTLVVRALITSEEYESY